MALIFDDYIINNYFGWEILYNGKYLYNNGMEDQNTLVYDVEKNDFIELTYQKIFNMGYQYVLFTSEYMIYHCKDNIIIEDYNNNIIKIINNNGTLITYLIKNDKYLFVCDEDDYINIYCINSFEFKFFIYSYHLNYINISNDNKYFITGWNNINVYDNNMELLINFTPKKEVSFATLCNKHIATVNQSITIYNKDGIELFELSNNTDTIHFLEYSQDNCYLYCGTKNELIIYEKNKYNIINKYNYHEISSYCLTNDNYKILYVNEIKIGHIYTPLFYQYITDLLVNHLPKELIQNILLYI